MSDTQTAAPGSPSKTPADMRTAPEEDRPYLQPPASREQGDAPIVQEPEERPQHGLAARPRRTSLMIVESADDRALASELPDEDAAFQKVRGPFSTRCPRGTASSLLRAALPSWLMFSLHGRMFTEVSHLGHVNTWCFLKSGNQ